MPEERGENFETTRRKMKILERIFVKHAHVVFSEFTCKALQKYAALMLIMQDSRIL